MRLRGKWMSWKLDGGIKNCKEKRIVNIGRNVVLKRGNSSIDIIWEVDIFFIENGVKVL